MKPIRVGLWTQSLLFVAGGANHFLNTPFYLRLMPDHYAHPRGWILATGVAEILGGVGLLVPRTRRVAGWGLAAMLVGFLDVHLFMLRHPERFAGVPLWALWARLPMQAALIGWALWATRRPQI